MFVCPKCKGSLEDLGCRSCGTKYELIDGIPDFLGPRNAETASELASIYDSIYSAHENVWEDQGREARFRTYFSNLVAEISSGRLLEIGCGEGLLLSAMSHQDKVGMDPSILALKRAKALSGATCMAAQAEFLPMPSSSIDIAVAVGVMEHYSDPDMATREILRVLKPHGKYVSLIHMDMSRADRLRLKVREYIFPRFRPIAMFRWAWKKAYKPIHQPFRRGYTLASARDLLSRNGFDVEQTITLKSDPYAPLAGSHVAILIASRPAA